MYLALVITFIIMYLIMRAIEISIGARSHAKLTQWNLAHSCNKQQKEDYRKNFGMADTRTRRTLEK